MIPYEWLLAAADRIKPYIHNTPLSYDTDLNAWIKWDNHQVTGSFKARGALNKVLILEEWERNIGLVAASAGNHGQGLALAGSITGAPVTIFASKHAARVKLDAIRDLGARVHLVEGGYPEAEQAGMNYAEEHHQTWVSPYNDGQVIAGQGTIALEVMDQLPSAEEKTWLVPVSGGGLIAGIGAGLKEKHPDSKLIGIQAEASPFTFNLFYHDTQDGVQDLPSLADGLTGAIDKTSITIPMMKHFVDDIVLVTEKEIRNAVAYAWFKHGEKVEGSGAVVLAVLLSKRVKGSAVAVISGGNINLDSHAEICAQFEREK